MDILYMSKINPFPPYGGAKIRAYNLIKSFKELGNSVDVIVPCEDIRAVDISDINVFYYPFKKLHLAFPFYKETALVNLIKKLMEIKKYDYAVLDYSFYGQYIQFFKKYGVKVIYGTHNSQAELILSDKRNVLYDSFSYVRYLFSTFHENIFFNKADYLLTVSDYDANYHSSFVSTDKIKIIPNFIDERIYLPTGKEVENYIVFTAKFDSFQNIEGAKWFFKKVWDKELENITSIKLVGTGSKEFLEQLKNDININSQKIYAFGEVDDVKPFIKNAKVAIIPLLEGSGTRLKCLEAMALKTPVVTTDKGAEGIAQADKAFFIANSPAEFKSAIIKCINNNHSDKTQMAYELFLNNYSSKATGKLLGELLILNIIN